jgi:hypothetical protein
LASSWGEYFATGWSVELAPRAAEVVWFLFSLGS